MTYMIYDLFIYISAAFLYFAHGLGECEETDHCLAIWLCLLGRKFLLD